MGKLQITIVGTLLCLIGHGQNDNDNLKKYWAYRNRLHQNFLRIGNDEGESIPMAARRIGYPYNHWDGNNPELVDNSSLYWSDGTIYLGHYIMVLATEFALLEQSGEKTESTINEIYFAINALNRIDFIAENYLSNQTNTLSADDVNGFLLRDDVPESFYDNFLTDHSIIFDQPCNFERVGSDYYVTDPFSGGAHTPDVNETNYQSLDQLTSIFSGLLFAHKFVGNVDVEMPELGITANIDDMVKSITLRLLNRLKEHEWRIAYWDGAVLPGNPGSGHNLTLAAPLFEDIAARIIDPFDAYYNAQIGEESIDIIELAIPKCRICDRIDEMLEFDSWSSLLLLSPHLDIWYAIECTGLTGDCDGEEIDVAAPLEALDVLGLIPVDIEMSDIRNAISSVEAQNLAVNTSNSGASKICVEIEKNVHLGIEGFATVNFEIPITICLRKGTLFGLLDNLLFDNIADNMQDDNVHIFLELATCSNVWGFDYVTSQAHLSDMDHYSLMHAVLNNNGQPWGSMDQNWYKTYFLDTSPCVGPFAHPYEKNINSGPIWASQNRLFHPGNAEYGPLNESGDPQTDFRGEFSGLDYMLYHNLYHILWGDESSYVRNVSCNCIEEITSESTLIVTQNIDPKFPDYKQMSIPIESFLAHDLTVTSSTGVLNVRNDLIICRELPEVQTTLRIENGATVNLYEENTITVREGNRIVLTAGGQLLAGLDNEGGSYLAATIVLEENAELIVEDDAAIICYQQA